MTHSFDRDPTAPRNAELPADADAIAVYLGDAGLANVSHPAEMPTAEVPAPEEFTDLLPQLRTSHTLHIHRANDGALSAYARARVARAVEPEERTPAQRQLLNDLATMRDFAPRASALAYEEVYTPTELHNLVWLLLDVESGDQATTRRIQDEIVDVLVGSGPSAVSKSLLNIARRIARGDTSIERRGWGATFIRMADVAGPIMRNKMLQNTDLQPYIVFVEDPHPTADRNLSSVYQFIATSHAYSVIAARNGIVRKARIQAFEANRDIINGWMTAHAGAINRLPLNFNVDERISAVWQLRNLVATMNARFESDDRSGRQKDYQVDPLAP